jgi:glycosyltransferase involved in cell wall biosynthesis/GT2 family glycosyltransferase
MKRLPGRTSQIGGKAPSAAAKPGPLPAEPGMAGASIAGLASMSVIISTCNRAANLADCLASLEQQSYADFELIVVVGPCTDATPDLLMRQAHRIKIVECPERNLSISRNRGIAAAAGEICAFIDDDAVAHPNWLERLALPYSEAKVGGAGGFTVDNTGARFQCRYTICDRFGNATLIDHIDPATRVAQSGLWLFPSLLGTNCSFRTALLRRIGGFDERFEYMLDETDVCLRLADLGKSIATVPDALVYHRYAESHVRDHRRIAKTLLAPSRSKAHFVFKHATARLSLAEMSGELDRFRADIRFSNRWHVDRALIDSRHFLRLNAELDTGLKEGIESGARAVAPRRVGSSGPGAAMPAPLLPFRSGKPAPLRIALVSQGYPPRDTAGIARWTHALAGGLRARGHHLHVITTSESDRRVEFRDGVWIHAVPSLPGTAERAPIDLPASIFARAAAVLTEARAIRDEFGLDLLSAPIWDVEGILCAAHLGVPVVTSLHTAYRMVLPLKERWRSDLPFRFHHVEKVIAAERWLFEHAALLLANSTEICRELQSLYQVSFDPARVAVVPHGIAPLDAPTAAQPDADHVRLLYVGRVERRKGLDLLLEAVMPLLEAEPRLLLDVVGAPVPEEAAFASLIAELRNALEDADLAAQVRFHGYVNDSVLAKFYGECDVFVAPSRFESFGLIAIEAMRHGKPVVATRVGGLAEIVQSGVSGELFEPESVESLRTAMAGLLAAPERCREMGAQAAAIFADRFTSDVMAERVERRFLDLLGLDNGGAAAVAAAA